MSNQTRIRRGPSIMMPIIVIGFGVMMLMSNLGAVDFDLWNFVEKFWPLIIVALGIDILLGRKTGIGVLLVVGIIALIPFRNRSGIQLSFRDMNVYTEHVSVVLDDSNIAYVNIDFGVGSLEIAGMEDDTYLLKGDLDLFEGNSLEENYQLDNDVIYYSVGYEEGFHGIPFPNRDLVNPDWDIEINNDIPIKLIVSSGVGEAFLHLEDIQLQEFNLEIGVGKVIVYLPDEGDFIVDIEGGIGELIVYVPTTLGARMIINTGIGNVDVPSGFDIDGSIYTNGLFSSSENRVDIRVDAGIGSVVIRDLP